MSRGKQHHRAMSWKISFHSVCHQHDSMLEGDNGFCPNLRCLIMPSWLSLQRGRGNK